MVNRESCQALGVWISMANNNSKIYWFINAGLVFWVIALACFLLKYTSLSLVFTIFSVTSFIFHVNQQRILFMFRKSKSDNQEKKAAMPELTEHVLPDEKELNVEKNKILTVKEPEREEKSTNTVVASGVRFDGNICSSGMIYIYGTIVGNVESENGIVKVMRSGQVDGNVSCRELIVDGLVKGECSCGAIDVYENGRIEGNIRYANLSIKKGGVFCGQAQVESKLMKQEDPKVIEMKKEVLPLVN